MVRRSGVRFIERAPARLVGELSRGRVDAALLPSLAYARDEKLFLVRGPCIASRGPVGSVRLFCRKPLVRVRRIAVDPDSVTSVGLLEILCARVWGIRPRLVPGRGEALGQADAVLWIGDAALREPSFLCVRIVDLGEAWTAWTGLPFVYALWMMRTPEPPPALLSALKGLARGLSSRAESAARREARRGEFTEKHLRRYLTRRIRYRFGPAQARGLARFYAEAHRLGLAGRTRPLVFADSGREIRAAR